MLSTSRKSSDRRRYRTQLEKLHGFPPMVAGLDVFFLLLLFIFTTSSLVRISGIGVELPRVKVSSVADVERFVVSVAPELEPGSGCRIYFQDRRLDMEELKQELFKLRAQSIRGSIAIYADHRVPHGVTVKIMALAESAGLPSIIATSPEENAPDVKVENW